MKKKIIISVDKFELKGVLQEEGQVSEIFIERENIKRIAGNIYKGKVANILPGMESAFVDIGLEKNAFLYVKDLREFEEKYLDGIENSDKPIEDILTVGDEVIVQILKEPSGTKGARVTTHYTIPGKYLVLMPNNDYIAVSKKIRNESERNRLTAILDDIKPEGVGVIIRTAANGKDESVFVKEVEYLIKQWRDIESSILKAKIGEAVYRESSVLDRILRDIFSPDVEELIIDSEKEYWKLIDYISAFFDVNRNVKVKLYREDKPILEYYGINSEINKALKKRVWLDCGGHLIIEKTEALISIDVNTGKNTGVMNLEETVLETNLEAAIEIPRQLRTRNLGGIIIIDFIDMKLEEDKKKLIEVLEENLKLDRIRNNIVRYTELGLVEMTRKRVGKELSTYFLDTCPMCKGRGKIKTVESVMQDIFIEIKELSLDDDISKIRLKVSDEIFKQLKIVYGDYITLFLKSKNKKIEFLSDKLFTRENYEILLEQ